MPVRIPDEDDDVPSPVRDLLMALKEEFPHENCLFFANSPSGGGPWTKSSIWMYYPDRRDRPDLCPENTTYLAELTRLVEDREPSTYSHVSGMDEHDYPDDAPDGAVELSKIHPKAC